jgi:hypothetical protein
VVPITDAHVDKHVGVAGSGTSHVRLLVAWGRYIILPSCKKERASCAVLCFVCTWVRGCEERSKALAQAALMTVATAGASKHPLLHLFRLHLVWHTSIRGKKELTGYLQAPAAFSAYHIALPSLP